MGAPGNLLIITHNFIPYCQSIGSALRMLKLAEFLADRGVATHVLAARGMDMGCFGYGGVLDKVSASYVVDPFQYASTLALSRRARPSAKDQPGKPVSRLMPALRSFAREVSVPDPAVYTAPLFAAKALQLIRRHGIRNVVVSSPPHSMQVAGWLVKLALKDMVNLVVDYRDTWNTTSIFRKRTLPFQALNAFLEARVLAACDRFVYCTSPMLDKVNRRFFDVTHKARLVMNGFDAPDDFAPPPATPTSDVITIGYFGSLIEHERGFRNPGLFFQALEKLRQPVRLVFYGSISISPAWNEKLSLEIHDAIPHGEALKRMQDMDALLLLHSEQEGADEVITGKFFDYVLAGRPILSVGPADMEASRMVREHGLGYAMDLYDTKDMLSTMERVLADWDVGNLPAPRRGDFLHFSREHQYEGFLDVLV